MKQHRKFIWDIGLIGTANILNNVKSFLIIPLLTKFLGAESYGAWTQLRVTSSLLLPFITLGTGQAIIKYLAGGQDKDKIREDFFSCFFLALAISLAIAVFCFVFPGTVSGLMFGIKTYGSLAKMFGILLVFESGNSILLEYFKTFRYMKSYFIILLLETVVELGLIAFIVLKGHAILWVVASLLFTRGVFVLVRLAQVYYKVGIGLPKFINLKKYIKFGMPLVFSCLFFFILNWSNRYFINYFLGLREVGIYSVAYYLAYVVVFITAPISYILLPTLSGFINRSENSEASLYASYSLKYFCLLGIPVVSAIFVLSKELLLMFSTRDFLVTERYLFFLLPAILIYQIGAIGEYISMVFSKNYIIMYVYIVLAVVSTILNLILIPELGLEGAAIAMFLSFICYGAFNLLYARRLLHFGINMGVLIKIALSTLIMVLSIYVIKNNVQGNRIFFYLPFSCLIYLAVLYVSGCFTKKEILLFKSLATNFGVKENEG